MEVTKNEAIFNVNGFIHKGWVKIIYEKANDDFTVNILNSNLCVIESYDSVHFDMLVGVIDSAVEKSENYNDKVREWLNNK